MDDVVVFGIIALTLPRVVVVGAAVGKAVVAGRENDVVAVDDTRADLSVWVLAALCREQAFSL